MAPWRWKHYAGSHQPPCREKACSQIAYAPYGCVPLARRRLHAQTLGGRLTCDLLTSFGVTSSASLPSGRSLLRPASQQPHPWAYWNCGTTRRKFSRRSLWTFRRLNPPKNRPPSPRDSHPPRRGKPRPRPTPLCGRGAGTTSSNWFPSTARCGPASFRSGWRNAYLPLRTCRTSFASMRPSTKRRSSDIRCIENNSLIERRRKQSIRIRVVALPEFPTIAFQIDLATKHFRCAGHRAEVHSLLVIVAQRSTLVTDLSPGEIWAIKEQHSVLVIRNGRPGVGG